MSDVTCTVNGKRAELFQKVFGTNIVTIESPLPELAKLPGLGKQLVYKLNIAELQPGQLDNLCIELSDRFGIPLEEITRDIATSGVPILAEDCIVTITGGTAIDLMIDDGYPFDDWEDELWYNEDDDEGEDYLFWGDDMPDEYAEIDEDIS